MHLARRNRDLPTNDRKQARGRNRFRDSEEARRYTNKKRKKDIAIGKSGCQPPPMRTILLIILILLLIGAFPSWPYSAGWGYYPSGGIGIILLIVLILALTGKL
jgi:hypothetical protein